MAQSDAEYDEFKGRHEVVISLQESLLQTKTVEGFLQAIVDRAAQHIAPNVACSVTTLSKGQYRCVASTAEGVEAADLVEYQTASGPCVEAATTGRENVIPDIREEDRWPEWTAASLRLGYVSAAGLPGDTGDGVQLALDLYSTEPKTFDEAAMRRARAYAEEAARTMRLCLILARQAAHAEQLQEALASRSTIDQALGVIMGQNQVPRDQAFAILRTASQHRNVKLREVARLMIENLTGHPAVEPPEFQQR